jgi:hypothetical protein
VTAEDVSQIFGVAVPPDKPTQEGVSLPHAPDAPEDPQDKKAYCEYGAKKEKEFIAFFDLHVEQGGVEINPKKATDIYAPDILLYGELADLKAQQTPFFTAGKYRMDPRFTVTFNRKDVARYSDLYPHLHIVFWIDWKTTEWSGIKVPEVHGVYLSTFAQVAQMIKAGAPEHVYKDRKNDRSGNAKSSYLFDVRELTRIYPPEERDLFPQTTKQEGGHQPCAT